MPADCRRLGDLQRCSVAGPRRHLRQQFAPVCNPRLAGREPLITGQFGQPENRCGRAPVSVGADRDDTPFVVACARVDVVHAGVVAQIGVACGPYRVGDIPGVELVDDGLGLGDMDPGSLAGPLAVDQRGQRTDRGDPPDHMIGEDRGRVVEPVPGAVGRPHPVERLDRRGLSRAC